MSLEHGHSQHDPTLFQGTASYYARYRSPYPREFFDHLVRVFQLDGRGRALDLGCGTGQLAIPLAPYFERVVAMDPDPEMIAEVSAASNRSGLSNLDFVLGSSFDLVPAMGEFRLVTMGESFHWMDRDQVLRTLETMIVPGGGLAIGSKKLNMPAGYQETVDQLLKEFLGEKRRAGQSYYSHPEERHETALARSSFVLLDAWKQECMYDWTISDAIGFLYSTSYANKRLLGDQAKHFEQELRRILVRIEPQGVFKIGVIVSALLARKESSASGRG
jgi:SAM-dependent methyltransferase